MSTRTSPPRSHAAGIGSLVLAIIAAAVLLLVPDSTQAAEDDPAINMAADAVPSVSFTRFPANVSTVNNGDRVFSGPVEVGYWTNWNFDRVERHWLEYAWERPVEVSRSVMSFWTDQEVGAGTGVAVPGSWHIEAWDLATETWTPVSEPSGYPVVRGEPNETTFTPVTTTRLRAVLDGARNTADTMWAATAVSEWEVYGVLAPSDPDTVIEVGATHVRTAPGVVPDLPATVRVVRLDGVTTTEAVDWESVDAAALVEGAAVEVAGDVDQVEESASATIHVRQEPSDVVEHVEDVVVFTTAGRRPSVPGTVIVTYDDGSRRSDVPVTWSRMSSSQYANEGDFELAGTVAGTSLQPTAYVIVNAATGDPDTGSVFTMSTQPAAPDGTNGWFTTPVTVRATSIDQVAVDAEHAVDGGPWTAGDVVEVKRDGTTQLAFREAGTSTDGTSVEVRLDRTVPSSSASYDASSRVLTLTASDATSGVERSEYRLSGGEWTAYAAAVTVPSTVSQVEHRSVDKAGNASAVHIVETPAPGGGTPPDGGTPTALTPATVAGDAVVGRTLTALPGTWDRVATFTYQWENAGGPIAGATGSTYSLRPSDVGTQVRVRVTATDAAGRQGASLSTPTATVTKARSRLRVSVRPRVLRAGQKTKILVRALADPPSMVATGRVVLKVGKRVVARAALVDGRASARLRLQRAGTWRIRAVYVGDAALLGSSGRVTVQVRPAR